MLASGRELTVDDLPMVEQLLSAYPFFTLPAAMMLKVADLSEDSRARLQQAVAINAPDGDSLMKLIDPRRVEICFILPRRAAAANTNNRSGTRHLLGAIRHNG